MMLANSAQEHYARTPIGTARPLRVIVIGAGISGILNAIKLPQQLENLELVVYEKNAGLGGTWWENRYPGIACDIPAHMYQLSWESNPAWSHYYASGPEILQYWQRVADKYDIHKYLKCSHLVTEARWNARDAKWAVSVKNLSDRKNFEDSADAIITAVGVLNQWEWPSIPGLMDFKGKLMHTARWDEDFNVQGKDVAVIGAGSSGIQIVPTIQPKVRQLDHYVRGRTWIATPMAAQEIVKRGFNGENFAYQPKEIESWENDPQSYLQYRKQIETSGQAGYEVALRGSENQKAKEFFRSLMTQRLSRKPELLEHFLPTFSPLCKRLTPGPGYLEALMEENVEVIVNPIARVTDTGIITTDGKQRDVDAIVCATGFNTHFTNRFPIIGEGGIHLFSERQQSPDSFRPRTATYLSMMTDNFPNMFMFLGPNSGLGAGNLLIILEKIADYTAQALRKMQTEDIRFMQPKSQAVDDFTGFCDSYFKRTVYSEECSSWYKTDGRVAALWPGSSLHAVKALERPRWEDFEYTYHNAEAKVPMSWLGGGFAHADQDEEADKAYYLTSLAFVNHNLGSLVNGQS